MQRSLAVSCLPATMSLNNQLYTRYSEHTSALCLEDRSYRKAVEYSDLKTWWHLFFFQIPVSSSQLPVSRLRLLDTLKNLHKKDFSAILVVLSLNAVAKENIHVRAKILVNLMLIGSCMWGSQPKHVSHMRHLAADNRYDLSHKSIVHTPKLETLPPKSVKSGRSSVKRASKAYILRPKRKSKQVCYMCLFTREY